jgi:hypothetical protein
VPLTNSKMLLAMIAAALVASAHGNALRAGTTTLTIAPPAQVRALWALPPRRYTRS